MGGALGCWEGVWGASGGIWGGAQGCTTIFWGVWAVLLRLEGGTGGVPLCLGGL